MLNYQLTQIAQKIGLDKAIAYTTSSKIIGACTGILSVFFISTFLTGVEQGYYYTFGSILALQIFFELGLTGIITQYVAHEASHLSFDDSGIFKGDDKYISRLASLVRFCIKWYGILSIIVFVFLVLVGFVFFLRYEEDSFVSWKLPWILICIATAFKLFQSPFNSILMGLGKIREMSEIGFWQSIALPAVTWICLACNFKLYVVGVGYLFSVVLWYLYILKKGLYCVILQLLHISIIEKVSYMKEIFPFQWRIALSSASGFLIFQLFNPVLFASDGAVVAGQMGMTWQALFAISSLAYSWQNTKIPVYCNYIALKDYPSLDRLFDLTVKQMVIVFSVLLMFFLVVLYFLRFTEIMIHDTLLADRFIGLLPTILLSIPLFLSQFVNSWAIYLRCHKSEPFLWNSVVNGIVSGIAILFFGSKYGLYGVTICYCVIGIAFFPWGYWIFKTKKAEWHK